MLHTRWQLFLSRIDRIVYSTDNTYAHLNIITFVDFDFSESDELFNVNLICRKKKLLKSRASLPLKKNFSPVLDDSQKWGGKKVGNPPKIGTFAGMR